MLHGATRILGVWTGLEKDDPLPILGAGAHARDQRDGCCVGAADGLLGGGRIRLRYEWDFADL